MTPVTSFPPNTGCLAAEVNFGAIAQICEKSCSTLKHDAILSWVAFVHEMRSCKARFFRVPARRSRRKISWIARAPVPELPVFIHHSFFSSWWRHPLFLILRQKTLNTCVGCWPVEDEGRRKREKEVTITNSPSKVIYKEPDGRGPKYENDFNQRWLVHGPWRLIWWRQQTTSSLVVFFFFFSFVFYAL